MSWSLYIAHASAGLRYRYETHSIKSRGVLEQGSDTNACMPHIRIWWFAICTNIYMHRHFKIEFSEPKKYIWLWFVTQLNWILAKGSNQRRRHSSAMTHNLILTSWIVWWIQWYGYEYALVAIVIHAISLNGTCWISLHAIRKQRYDNSADRCNILVQGLAENGSWNVVLLLNGEPSVNCCLVVAYRAILYGFMPNQANCYSQCSISVAREMFTSKTATHDPPLLLIHFHHCVKNDIFWR